MPMNRRRQPASGATGTARMTFLRTGTTASAPALDDRDQDAGGAGLWHWLRERPVSECGRLCRGDGHPARGHRRWRVLVLAILPRPDLVAALGDHARADELPGLVGQGTVPHPGDERLSRLSRTECPVDQVFHA